MIPIELRVFRARSSRVGLTQYHAIRYQVFNQEQGWCLPCDENRAVTLPDAFDAASVFVLALGPEGNAVGVVRATRLISGAPHEHLFKAHAHTLTELGLRNDTAMITGLAVLPEYRARLWCVDSYHGKMTIGNAMLARLFEALRRSRVQVALLTTSVGPLIRYFFRLGFFLMDGPVAFSGPARQYANMGVLIRGFLHPAKRKKTRSRTRGNASAGFSTAERDFQKYLLRRHRFVAKRLKLASAACSELISDLPNI